MFVLFIAFDYVSLKSFMFWISYYGMKMKEFPKKKYQMCLSYVFFKENARLTNTF
jgi:hypothetical protein